jgi:hypothetical protein
MVYCLYIKEKGGKKETAAKTGKDREHGKQKTLGTIRRMEKGIPLG